MTKEEFLTKSYELFVQIEHIRKQGKDLQDEYIASNQPYPVGTKVKVSDGQCEPEFGVVTGYEICGYDVRPILAKIKKDGTAHSTAKEYVAWWRNPTVEVCD